MSLVTATATKAGMRSRGLFRSKWFLGFLFLIVVVLLLVGRPAWHLARTIYRDRDDSAPRKGGTIDDASRLNETKISEMWKVPSDTADAEKQLAALLQRARSQGLKVSISGARHSMGGHTISSNGIVLDMLPFHQMKLNKENNLLWVQSGARWSDVIEHLNALGRSPEIMQSNHDFTVGGSISVNCHGWQFNRPPIASSVESFRLMKADGTIVRCSRSENAELFSLALGGYGLFGIILDANLRVVPNETYLMERHVVSTTNYIKVLERELKDSTSIAMVYGRMRVTREKFLAEGILNILHRERGSGAVVTTFTTNQHAQLKRAIFRGSVGSDYGKDLRWTAERNWDEYLSGKAFARNALLYQPVSLFQNRRYDSTDILMECFVPPILLDAFLADLREAVNRSGVDLLNVTVRHVNEDKDTFLRYATEDMAAVVMLFNQNRTVKGEERMARAANEIIEAAYIRGGRYYLPYRLHATPEQFALAYPQATEFFLLKRKYDPGELFVNQFYLKYAK